MSLTFRGILGLLGLHFFWFSALLVPAIGTQPFPLSGVKTLDYRPWLGILGILNTLGIFLYQSISNWYINRPYRGPVKVRRASSTRMAWVLALAIIVGFIAQAYVLSVTGFHVKSKWADDNEFAQGLGIPTVLRASLPVILMFAFTCLHLRTNKINRRTVLAAAGVLSLLTLFALVINGLTGNRGVTVFTAFWIACIIHYYWRPFRKREVVVLILCGLLFMFTYLFYKQYGVLGLKTFLTQGHQAAQATGRDRVDRSFESMLVGDLSRTHLQAYAVFVLYDKPYPYELRYGSTVFGDVQTVLPRWLYPNKYNIGGYSGKHEAGTDLIRGTGKFDPTTVMGREPRTWGLGGIAMLNFGIYSVPFAYAFFGLVVGWVQRTVNRWQTMGDIRLLFGPMMFLFIIVMLTMDTMVLTLFGLRYWVYPLIIVWLGSSALGRFPHPPNTLILTR